MNFIRALSCFLYGHNYVPIDEMVESDVPIPELKRRGIFWFCRTCGAFERKQKVEHGNG